MSVAVGVAVPDGDDESARQRSVELVLAMLAAASERTRREVHKLLAAELQPPPTAAQKRLAELSFLSSLINGPVVGDGPEFRQCERLEYDRLRPPGAPSSRHLVETYGSWSRACRAAYGLQEDGTTTGPGRPWPGALRGEPRPEQFTREEAIAAVQRCAAELSAAGITGAPTSWQYDEWVRRHKLEAERRSQTARLPSAAVVYRLFLARRAGLSRWQLVLRAAGLG